MSINETNKKLVEDWNKKYSKETSVRYFYSEDLDEYELTYTKSKAYLTRLPYPVILLNGHVKLVSLLKVQPVGEVK